MPHRRRTQMVHWHSPGGASVQSTKCMLRWAHPSPPSNWHLGRFSQFRPTDHPTRSVTIGHIYVRSTAMQPNNNEINNEKFCTQFCVLLLLRCFKLASPLRCYDRPDESLSSNVSRLTQGWPSSNRMEHFQKSKLCRGRLASSRGFENAFGNGLSCYTVKLFSSCDIRHWTVVTLGYKQNKLTMIKMI